MARKDAPSTATVSRAAREAADEAGSDVTNRSSTRGELGVGDVLLSRWELLRLLGKGGAGAVFAARDRERGGEVALKVLTHVSAGALYRLKNEFRALSDVAHPNLVRLLELAHQDDHWFVVMELVHGVDFMSYVRAGEHGYDLARLRRALRGLAEGVAAIHAAHKLHRDLKPSNVLVAQDGQVVIVDFGLVSGQHLGDAGQTVEGVFLGTPAYASPEQLAGLAQTTATDWYAVGLMLYEVLTGRPARTRSDMFEDATRELPAPSTIADVPPELDRLCVALLAHDPARRADAAAVRSALGAASEREPEAGLGERPIFVGRDGERAALDAALRATRDGRPRVVLVHGPSGIGKTALVRCFLDELRGERALALSGRCYAQEKVPYKAFDAIVDQLSRHLAALPELEVARLLPRDTAALTRMFPTLARVEALRRPPERLDARDEQGARVRAFHALKELLARIADRQPLVICVDDIQWGDLDSARLLCELLAAPDAPAALFVCTYRSEERATSPMLRELLANDDFAAVSSELGLAPLSEHEARTLVTLVDERAAPHAAEIVDEAKGSPFFLGELIRHLSTYGTLERVGDVIAARVDALGPGARALLETLCVAGRPVPITTALQAAGSSEATTVRELSLASLARTRSLFSSVTLEPYHDRVRETVSAGLSGPRERALNLALARGYEQILPADPEALMQFYLRAGERTEAARFARAAADTAAQAFAFERAAEHLRVAAEHPAHAQDAALHVALAQAYERAGRPIEAAETFERAAQLTPSGQSELVRRAMRLYVQAAHLERGRALLRQLCRELDIYYPLSGLLALLLSKLLLLAHRQRRRVDTWLLARPPVHRLKRERLQARFDLLWSAATGLHCYGDGEALWFLVRALLTARSLGSAESVPLAMMIDDVLSLLFKRNYDVASQEQRVARALAWARTADRPELVPTVLMYIGNIWGHYGDVTRSAEALDEADRLLNERGLAASCISPFFRAGQLITDYMAGRLSRSAPHALAWMREAKERRDVYTEALLGVVGAHYHLIGDAPDAAIAMMDYGYGLARGFEHPCSGSFAWRATIELYSGRPARVLELARQPWRWSANHVLERRLAIRRIGALLLTGLAISAEHAAKPRSELLRELQRRIRALGREPLTFGLAAGLQLTAQLAHMRGERERERSALEAARDAYAECGMRLYATACSERLGRVIGGDEGRSLVDAARSALTVHGVVNPEHWFAMLVPGRY